MDRSKFCGCKGIRTCLRCEHFYGLPKKNYENKEKDAYVYCMLCNKCWEGWDMNDYKSHPNHSGKSLEFPGINIKLNFISEEEEKQLINDLDSIQWNISQSGRRKQNFGPKCNFKKRKLKIGEFNGFPNCTKFIQDRFKSINLLKDYQTIEQCTLEYENIRGSSIDPHIDDCWIWGERIVTVNLLEDSVLTLKLYEGDKHRYNLDCQPSNKSPLILSNNGIVRVPMPRRSLLIMYDSARYNWEHWIYREDIYDRRVCLAYREFTKPYLEGGSFESEGKIILEKAQLFF